MTHPDLGNTEHQHFHEESLRIAQSRTTRLDTERARVRSILDKVSYSRHGGTWSLYLGTDGDRLYLQVHCAGQKTLIDAKEMLTRLTLAGVVFDYPYITEDAVREAYAKRFPDDGPWTGRKWMLSPHMVLSEIVRTAYLAYEAAERHEIQEAFRYKGAAVMGPHQHMDELADLMNRGVLHDEVRKNGMQGA